MSVLGDKTANTDILAVSMIRSTSAEEARRYARL